MGGEGRRGGFGAAASSILVSDARHGWRSVGSREREREREREKRKKKGGDECFGLGSGEGIADAYQIHRRKEEERKKKSHASSPTQDFFPDIFWEIQRAFFFFLPGGNA